MRNASVPDDLSPQCGLRGYLTEGIKSLFKSAAAKLKGNARRLFLAETVEGARTRRAEFGGARARVEPRDHTQRNARAQCRH